MNKEEEKIRKQSPVQIRNKKASFEYFFIETFTAGIVLTGTEIKSIRLGLEQFGSPKLQEKITETHYIR